MDHFNVSPNGMYYLNESIIRVENALIEEVVTKSRRSGYLLISYEVPDQNNQISISQVRLNLSRNTIIIDQFGEALYPHDLKRGMRIDAEFSSAMTKSIPPQANAIRIIVLSEMTSINTTIDRVINVNKEYGFLNTGNPYDMYDQMVFTISDSTIILDQNGDQIPLEAIQPGQLVRVEHAMFQTMSIPPQSPAYRVQIL